VNALVVLGVAPELAGLGVALPHAGAHLAGLLVTVVRPVAAPRAVRLRLLQPVVGVDPLLIVGCYVPIVVEGGAFLDLGLVHRDLDAVALFVYPGKLPRDKARPLEPEEAHLYANVLGLIALVDEEVVDLAYLLVVAVVDLVPCVLLFDARESIAAVLHRCD